MRDFSRHQKSERFLYAGIIGQVDQSLVDDLGPRFRRDVRAKICSWFSDRIDVRRGPGYAAGVDQRCAAPVQERHRLTLSALIQHAEELSFFTEAFG